MATNEPCMVASMTCAIPSSHLSSHWPWLGHRIGFSQWDMSNQDVKKGLAPWNACFGDMPSQNPATVLWEAQRRTWRRTEAFTESASRALCQQPVSTRQPSWLRETSWKRIPQPLLSLSRGAMLATATWSSRGELILLYPGQTAEQWGNKEILF